MWWSVAALALLLAAMAVHLGRRRYHGEGAPANCHCGSLVVARFLHLPVTLPLGPNQLDYNGFLQALTGQQFARLLYMAVVAI